MYRVVSCAYKLNVETTKKKNLPHQLSKFKWNRMSPTPVSEFHCILEMLIKMLIICFILSAYMLCRAHTRPSQHSNAPHRAQNTFFFLVKKVTMTQSIDSYILYIIITLSLSLSIYYFQIHLWPADCCSDKMKLLFNWFYQWKKTIYSIWSLERSSIHTCKLFCLFYTETKT